MRAMLDVDSARRCCGATCPDLQKQHILTSEASTDTREAIAFPNA
jgi:hypothetical protein